MNRKIFLIIPVYNEIENLENLISSLIYLVNELNQFDFEFILVDDGSDDGTSDFIEKNKKDLNFNVIISEKNLGPGNAFSLGFDYLHEKVTENDFVVTIEGDNTSRVETLLIMINRIVRENIDVALASPLSYGGGVTNTKFHRQLLGHCASALTKLLLNIRGINTFTSFFRVFKGSVIIKLQEKYGSKIIEAKGFECMVELLKKITILNFSITEVPMNLDTSLRKGKSKLKVLKTMINYFVIFYKSRTWKR